MSTDKTMLQFHAEHELDVLCKSGKPDNRPVVEPFVPEILGMVGKFKGMSGGEAMAKMDILLACLRRLLMFQPLCPLTGIAEEWVNVTEQNGGVTLFQNNRCPAVFKDLTGAWYLDAVVFKAGKDNTFTTSGQTVHIHTGGMIGSRMPIEFPFKPKTFYIDVFKRTDGEWQTRDERQLKAVYEYYKKASRIIKM